MGLGVHLERGDVGIAIPGVIRDRGPISSRNIRHIKSSQVHSAVVTGDSFLYRWITRQNGFHNELISSSS
jgi:hypothetical protein